MEKDKRLSPLRTAVAELIDAAVAYSMRDRRFPQEVDSLQQALQNAIKRYEDVLEWISSRLRD